MAMLDPFDNGRHSNRLFHRSMYDGLQKIVDNYEQRDKECLFFAFLQNVFIDSLVMGVRRQIKRDQDSISLVRLLCELIETPEIVTRESYYALWRRIDPDKSSYMARDFSILPNLMRSTLIALALKRSI